ncbi:MAG: radical SAM protein [Candidatus Cloacimonetes bacterium]|nr:radical SAM protein [Candidatus Cloacimonadota bacterium]
MLFKQRDLLDKEILARFSQALSIMGSSYPRLPFYLKALADQVKAQKLRKRYAQQGLEVPPILIFSITRRCNLNCAGCYSRVLHASSQPELSIKRFEEIFSEAASLGISVVLLAGGEPLVRREVLNCAASFSRILFPVFTNGLLLDEDYAGWFADHPNLLPVLSLEGRMEETDLRRGKGVFQQVGKALDLLNGHKLFWGTSLTLTSENYSLLLSDAYVRGLIQQGCKLFFFVEYVPIQENSEHLVLSDLQKELLSQRIKELKSSHPALFVPLPGDEDYFEGCLAAGRGFLHINPVGKVEPCPFAPFSDVDLSFTSIRDALSSPLLAKIREQHHLLSEGKGGCALWANRSLVQELLD